jgi:dihydroorotate dehydrogenase electron transfer subunit
MATTHTFRSRYIVRYINEVGENTFVVGFVAPTIAESVLPGQFVNIKAGGDYDPLLRRPFSVYRTDGEIVEVVFNVVGRGTSALRNTPVGASLDVLGPLGVPFQTGGAGFTTAILVAGGLGVAPLPLTTASLLSNGKKVTTILGARHVSQLVTSHLENLHTATDDGSAGYHGTVVEYLEALLAKNRPAALKLFGCGPTAMLRALAAFALREKIACEVSLEGPMACGVGICQGCPVETNNGGGKYALMCKDGPIFDVSRIRI